MDDLLDLIHSAIGGSATTSSTAGRVYRWEWQPRDPSFGIRFNGKPVTSEAACPKCGSELANKLYIADGTSYLKCGRCEHRYNRSTFAPGVVDGDLRCGWNRTILAAFGLTTDALRQADERHRQSRLGRT